VISDLTITETPLDDGRIRYELGRPNWRARQIPDIRVPGAVVQLPENRMIDIVVLGDGYTDASVFRADLDAWLANLYTVEVYDRFAGCLRIRALYTQSDEEASVSRGSYYGCQIADGGGLDSQSHWERDPGAENDAFRAALWESVDTFDDLNPRRYPHDLTTGDDLAINQGDLRGLYRNLIVAMLVKCPNPSGFNGAVPRPAPDEDRKVRVAFGAYAIHELSHGLGMLNDEYIHNRTELVTKKNPTVPSVFSLSNVRFSDRIDEIPWIHLSPWGIERRSAGGKDASPLIGWLWIGGGRGLRTADGEVGVWHSEYKCLMNGGHANYQFTQYGNDPTDVPDDDYEGANLREDAWFCLWCQELVTIRLLERTDQLLEPGDPADATTQGQLWYARWVDELRANYLQLFDVPGQLVEREAYYASLTPGPAGEPLWESDLYSVPKAAPAATSRPAPPLADDETLLLAVSGPP
jgi:hypothetical protein